MDGLSLQRLAMSAALALPGATQSQPFGPGYEVFKVGGKIFLMTAEVAGEPIITLKCEAHRSLILREVFANITPGYHMNKRLWISVAGARGFAEDLVVDLVDQAFELVVLQLPKANRP